MDAGINSLTGDATGKRINTLANAVYLRLMTPLGSYWADPQLGSRLYTLRREKDKSRVGRLAAQYAESALKPILSDGRAISITVSVEQPHNGWLLLGVDVVQADGQAQTFTHNVRVI